jgi:hypothetical protein
MTPLLIKYFFALNPTDTTGTNVIQVQPGLEVSASATDLGFNQEQEIIRLNVNNPNPAQSAYLIQWE